MFLPLPQTPQNGRIPKPPLIIKIQPLGSRGSDFGCFGMTSWDPFFIKFHGQAIPFKLQHVSCEILLFASPSLAPTIHPKNMFFQDAVLDHDYTRPPNAGNS